MGLVMIAAGGTGGHIFPGLAVAESLIKNNHQVIWIGNSNSMEERLVKLHKIQFKSIYVRPMRGTGILGAVISSFSLFYSLLQCLKLLVICRPKSVLVMGGYVSVPLGLAAKIMQVKLFLHEQNAVAGMANKLLVRFANTAFTAIGEPFGKRKNVKKVGNPIRDAIKKVRAKSPSKGNLRCLVLGGSQGAKPLNDIVLKAMLQMDSKDRPTLWHQVGEKHYAEYQKQYQGIAKVSGFIDDIADAYSWADIIISRSGAMAVSELLHVGAYVAWVPYPHAVDDHQTRNAQYAISQAPGLIWQEQNVSVKVLHAFWTAAPMSVKKDGFNCLDSSGLIVSELV